MATIQILNNGDAAVTFRTKLNSNFSALNDGKADTNHASSGNTYGLATDSLYGHIKVTSNNGLTLSNGVLTMALASVSAIGAVQLTNSYTSSSSTLVPTAAALNNGIASTVKTSYGKTDPTSTTGKDGDIYIKIA